MRVASRPPIKRSDSVTTSIARENWSTSLTVNYPIIVPPRCRSVQR